MSRFFIQGLIYVRIAAEREAGGLCCPVELSGLLKSAFAKMDEELLKWLKGACSHSTQTLPATKRDPRAYLLSSSLNRANLPFCCIQGSKDLLPKQCAADTQDGEEQTSGSTATIVLARNDKVVVANVGDSRAVLSRSGQSKNLSTEHRQVHDV